MDQLLLAASKAEVEAARAARLGLLQERLQQQHQLGSNNAEAAVASEPPQDPQQPGHVVPQGGAAGAAAATAAAAAGVVVLVPREASSSEVLAAAKALLKARELLVELQRKLQDTQVPVRCGGHHKTGCFNWSVWRRRDCVAVLQEGGVKASGALSSRGWLAASLVSHLLLNTSRHPAACRLCCFVLSQFCVCSFRPCSCCSR